MQTSRLKKYNSQIVARLTTLMAAVFLLSCFAGPATAQVGLTQQQVKKDVSAKLAEATASMLTVDEMKIVRSTETTKGRFEIDIEMTVEADERAIRSALDRANTNRLSSDWREQAARVGRIAQDARAKDGLTETIKAIYQLNRSGAWQLTEVSDNTSEYTRLRNENGQNSAPEEALVLTEFESLIKLLSNEATSISSFEITSATALPDNQVQLSIQMGLKSARSPKQNAEFARQVNGLTNTVDVIYQRNTRGIWRRIQ